MKTRKFKMEITFLSCIFSIQLSLVCIGAANTEVVVHLPYMEQGNTEPEEWLEPEPGGQIYVLEHWQVKEVEPEPYSTQEEKMVLYHEVEWADAISDAKEFTVSEENTGRQQAIRFPLLWTEYGDYVWKDGFEFPVTVENWDAEYYMLGDQLVPRKEENPFEGYEEQLLQQLGLDISYYKVFFTAWVSDAYEEQGIWYRKAEAKGQKLVADLTAVYGGGVTWVPEPLTVIEAVYKMKADIVVESVSQELQNLDEAVIPHLDQSRKGMWERLWHILTTSWILKLSILFFLCTSLAIFFLLKYYKNHKKEKADRY